MMSKLMGKDESKSPCLLFALNPLERRGQQRGRAAVEHGGVGRGDVGAVVHQLPREERRVDLKRAPKVGHTHTIGLQAPISTR